jgi:hypothetical protein
MNCPRTLGPCGRLRPNGLGMPVTFILLDKHVFTPHVGSTAVTLNTLISREGRETLLGIHDQVDWARVRPAMTHPPIFQLGYKEVPDSEITMVEGGCREVGIGVGRG